MGLCANDHLLLGSAIAAYKSPALSLLLTLPKAIPCVSSSLKQTAASVEMDVELNKLNTSLITERKRSKFLMPLLHTYH